jgi:glycosyltransferase involved in cell wall biosynthesis
MKKTPHIKLLCMVHLSPPINGVSVMSELVVNSLFIRKHYILKVISLQSSISIADIGKFRISKLRRIFVQAWRLFYSCCFDRPDLIYFTLTPNGKAFYRDFIYVCIMKLFRIKRVYHLHGKGISKFSSGFISNYLYLFAFKNAKVILLSPLLFDDAHQFLKYSDYYFLPNGVVDHHNGDFKIKFKVNIQPTILFFSNLIASKGLFVLLEALTIMKNSGISFKASFAGNWESKDVKDEFYDIVQKNELQNIIDLCGPKHGLEKHNTFANADIMTLPTFNDAYPLVLLEAMSHGLPIVSTYEGAISDIVIDGETGFLVPPQDVHMLADRLTQLINDDDLRIRMKKASRARYKMYFTEDKFLHNLSTILEKCLQN